MNARKIVYLASDEFQFSGITHSQPTVAGVGIFALVYRALCIYRQRAHFIHIYCDFFMFLLTCDDLFIICYNRRTSRSPALSLSIRRSMSLALRVRHIQTQLKSLWMFNRYIYIYVNLALNNYCPYYCFELTSMNWSGIFMLLSTFSVRRDRMNESSPRFDSHTWLFMISFFLFILVNFSKSAHGQSTWKVFAQIRLHTLTNQISRNGATNTQNQLELDETSKSSAYFVERENTQTHLFLQISKNCLHWKIKWKQKKMFCRSKIHKLYSIFKWKKM